MGGKTAVAAGLLMGVLAGAGALAAVVLLAPDVRSPVVTTPAPTQPAAPSGDAPASSSPPASTPVVGSSPPGAGPPGASPPGAGSPSPGGTPAAGGSPSPARSGTGLFGVGDPAPALSLPQLGGGTIDLAALRGKPVWVNFMATSCLPCRDELPLMAGYAVRYQSQGLVVIPVDVREDDAAVEAFMRTLGVSFSTALDRDGSAQAAWGADALPVHFWIGADGIIRDGALGEIGPDIMTRGLQTILPGVDVTT